MVSRTRFFLSLGFQAIGLGLLFYVHPFLMLGVLLVVWGSNIRNVV